MGDPFVALASVAEDLKKQNIPVVEYGEILNVRFGYPACIQPQTFKWGVADPQLSLVSNILLAHNILQTPRHMGNGRQTCGIMHKCGSTRIHIIPLSSICLSLDDCEEKTSAISKDQKVMVPKPRPYLISLVRRLLTLPLGLPRLRITSNLGLFLGYCVFPRLPDGEDAKSESEEYFQQRMEQALSCVHQWD